MKTSALIAAFALSVLTSVSAAAQVAPRRPDQARIRQGVRSGQLTPAEAARAQKQQADARQARQAARADGVVTPTERKVVRHEERQADRVLYRQKHDGQTRVVR
ncbi:hypothetical protein [Hymenobacter metallilatus]|uniref:DUF4148 domain-containing protein n=1 Tax=Hymenobacter metallilatus TaxID=2493666 RepID=A0A3R9NKL7_9BACT|nr:hypothetical protein [Hymenobacter metallilatus]RSK35413.1 hypothetical protein EI290_06875 [Hymenobacter metallilatus]